MKRSALKPTKRMIARLLIAEYNKEQEAIALRKKLDEAREAHENRPRIGPKHPPVFLPYKENEAHWY